MANCKFGVVICAAECPTDASTIGPLIVGVTDFGNSDVVPIVLSAFVIKVALIVARDVACRHIGFK